MTQIVMLIGGSNSGKTTVAACLQDMLPSPWLHLGVDTLIDAMPKSLLTTTVGIAFGADGSVHPGVGISTIGIGMDARHRRHGAR